MFFFAKVITFSANRWASFAFGHVVEMDSCVKREVTRLRSKACRWDDFRPRCRYFRAPPAIVRGGAAGGVFFFLSFFRPTAVPIRLQDKRAEWESGGGMPNDSFNFQTSVK